MDGKNLRFLQPLWILSFLFYNKCNIVSSTVTTSQGNVTASVIETNDTDDTDFTTGAYNFNDEQTSAATNNSRYNTELNTNTTSLDTTPENLDASSSNNGTQSNGNVLNVFAGALIDKASYEEASYVISYVGLCTSVVALVWNSVAIHVYTRMRRNPTNIYMGGVTVLDVSYLASAVASSVMVLVLGGESLYNRFYLVYAIYVSSTLMPCVRKTIITVTMMLSLERLLAIAFPLKAKTTRIIRHPIPFIIGCFVFVFAFQSYGFFKLDVDDVFNPRTNTTNPSIVLTEFGRERSDVLKTLDYVGMALFTHIPLAIIIITNILLVAALHRYGSRRRSQRADDSPSQFYILERQKAILILTYTFLFVLLTLPFAMNVLVTSIFPEYGLRRKEHYVFLLMQRVHGLLDVFSSSINFPVYVAMSSAFRNELKTLFVKQRPKDSGSASSSATLADHTYSETSRI